MNELRLYSLIAIAGAGLLFSANAWARSRRKTPDQKERERRMRISEMGRITDGTDRKSTRLNSSHIPLSRMPSSA